MKNLTEYVGKHRLRVGIGVLGVVFALVLMFWRLGSLTAGLSPQELKTLNTPVGLHALYNNPFYLPLELVRSVLFVAISDFGALIGRIPNALFGLLAVASFAYVVLKWHGRRTAIFSTALFATSAWVLHVSRTASFDVLYLCAIPVLLCTGILLQKHANKALVFYGTLIAWLALLYVPGMVWLIALTWYWQRDVLLDGWKSRKAAWQRLLSILLAVLAVPLLLLQLFRPGQLLLWLGIPGQWDAPVTIGKHFVAVGVHLFVRGPQYPDIWLAKAPIFDIFTLVMCAIGIYFYARHVKAFRTKMLLSYVVVGWLLVGIHGAVDLSLLIPIIYVLVAAGIAYLLREWLQVFPMNPFARGLGVTLISVAVLLSCLYNVRAYFVAWPNNSTTKALFRYDR